VEGAGAAVALDKGHDGGLVFVLRARATAALRVLALAADVGLVSFDRAREP
jgi:hypothetical protein